MGSLVVYAVAAAIVALRAVRVRHAARAWIVLAAGLTLYGAGNLVWALWLDRLAAPPIPSICDGLWLALYPASYLGLVLLARGATARSRPGSGSTASSPGSASRPSAPRSSSVPCWRRRRAAR